MRKYFFLFILLAAGLQQAALAQFGGMQNPVTWKQSVKQLDNNQVLLIFDASIEKGWQLYGQNLPKGGPMPLEFLFEASPNYKPIGKVTPSPKPKEKMDEVFEIKVKYFEKKVRFSQRIDVRSEKDFVLKVAIEGQACQHDGMCVLVPHDFEFKIKGAVEQTSAEGDQTEQDGETQPADSLATDTLSESTQDSSQAAATPPPPPENDEKRDLTGKTKPMDLAGKSLWVLFWFSFVAGLLAIFTPCVFPMIPMTVTFFMHDADNKAKSRFQAGMYGLSIIFIYTVIGTLIAVLFGANFANWLSTHWIPNVLFFLIFMFFAASFLGMFEITLPSSWVEKMDKQADRGGILAPFFMAFTLVLVSFSCTGPLVGAILVESAGGAVLEPIVGMFGFALAFALPFTLFAFFPAWLKRLPKSGGWLNSVKVVLGFIELALGLKFLSVADQTYHWGILDREIYIALWIVIFALMGLYLLGKIKFAHDSDIKYLSVPRLALVIITFSFVIYLVPGMFGAPLKALSGYLPPQSTHDFDTRQIVREVVKEYSIGSAGERNEACAEPKYAEFLHLPHGLEGYFDYEQGLACAKKQNKPIFIDFTGHGCVNCREMEANVWADPAVLKRLKEEFVIIALYVDDKTKLPEEEWVTSSYDNKVKKTIGKKYADFQISRFGVNAQPYYVLLDTEGNELVEPQAYDLDVNNFIHFLDRGLKEFHDRQQEQQ